MKKRLFLFLFLFVCCFDYVYADAIQTINFGFNNGYVNSSKTNSSVNRGSCSATKTASDSGPTFNNNFNLYLLKKGKETTPGTVTKSIPYSIVIMVDTTVSMKGKTDATNNAVKTIINKFKNTDSYVAVYSFNSSLSTPKSLLGQKGFTDVNNALNNYKPLTDNSVDGQSTNLQSGVITAYRLLRDNANKHSETAPMLIFITDGYPTVGYSTDAVNKTDKYYSSSLIKSSGTKVTASSARIAYYAAKTFVTFEKGIKNLGYRYKDYSQLITYGIRLNSFTQQDEYLNFILNPSEDKFNKLNFNDEVLYSTESKTLYNLISSSGKKETFYETVARFDDYPDAGVFKGVVKYNKKEKKYVVKYYIPKNRWDSIKKSKINSNKQFRVYCSGAGFTNVKNLNEKKLSVEGNFYVYTKKCDSVGTYSSSNFKNGWFTSTIKSMTGSIDELTKGLSKLVNQSISEISNSETNLDDGKHNIKYTLKNVAGKTHDYSVNFDVPLRVSGELYYKLPDTLEFDAISNSQDVKVKLENLKFMNNLNFDSSSAVNNCVQLKNASVSVVVKNTKSSIEVTPSKIVDYPGSGFEMSASIKSSVAWYYSFLNSSTVTDASPNVNIELNNNDYYYIVSGSKDDYSCFSSQNNGSCVLVKKLNYININSIFTDNKCTTKYTEKNNLNEKVWNELKERALSDSIEGTDFFESVDSNDKNKKSFISTTVINPKVPEDLLPGNPTELVYTFSLNRGCISTADDNVNGTEVTNGSVLYSDEIGQNGNDNTCINMFGSKFINGMSSLGNNQYFIPTDYPDKKVSIELNNKSFSIIHGVVLNYNLKCDVDVGGSVLKYNFRTIDVNNPFPGGKKGKDWEEWYNKSSNVSRMANSYNNLYYSVTFGSHTFWDTGSYLSWSNMNANGSSTFIDDKFEKKASDTSYCSIGYFSDDCDKY